MTYKPKAIICDLDGTLVDSSHRRHFVFNKENIKDWDGWTKATGGDKANQWCVDLIESMADNDIEVIFLTGRSEASRKPTIDWLRRNLPGFDRCLLYMRPVNDRREDYTIKQEIYNNVISKQFEVIFAIDDKDSVVDMWRENGVVCLHCAKWTSEQEEEASKLNDPNPLDVPPGDK